MALIVFVAVACCSYLIEAISQGDWASWTGELVIAQYALTSTIMFYIWHCSKHGRNKERYSMKRLATVAIIAQLILLPISSYSSNDVLRYLFDGALLVNGADPYSVNHQSDIANLLKQQWSTPTEHEQYSTIYPPIAIYLFAFASSFGADWAFIIWKLMLCCATIGIILIMYHLLNLLKLQQHFALVALSPLLLYETAVGAHVDGFTMLAVTLALLAYQQQRYALTGTAIAIGTTIKLLPIVLLLPLLSTNSTSINNRIRLLVSSILTLVIIYGFSWSIGLQLFGSIDIFFEKWRFGSPFFSFLNWLGSDNSLISLVLLVTLQILIIYLARKDIYVAMLWSMTIVLLLSPVAFPWYWISLIPLLALRPSWFILAWVTLTPTSYEVLSYWLSIQLWQPAQWPLWLMVVGSLVVIVKKLRFLPSSIQASSNAH